jgi:hypothetical protein
MKQTQTQASLVRFKVAVHQGNCCILAKARGQWAPIVQYHHRLHDTLPNHMRFPLLINSMWNLVGVSVDPHMEQPSALGMSVREAESRERWLQRHPRAAAWLNGQPRLEWF